LPARGAVRLPAHGEETGVSICDGEVLTVVLEPIGVVDPARLGGTVGVAPVAGLEVAVIAHLLKVEGVIPTGVESMKEELNLSLKLQVHGRASLGDDVESPRTVTLSGASIDHIALVGPKGELDLARCLDRDVGEAVDRCCGLRREAPVIVAARLFTVIHEEV
jgi:hypothetical protein